MNLILQPSHAELNAAALNSLLCQPVSQSLISRLVESACSIGSLPSSFGFYEDDDTLSLENFLWTLTFYSGSTALDLMGALVYLSRLKTLIRPEAEKGAYTNHRYILVSLILASKYLNDQWLRNKDWARWGMIDNRLCFSPAQVNLMERQILDVLNWNLRITENDLLNELEPILCPIRERLYQQYVRNFWVAVNDWFRGSAAGVGRITW